MITEPHTQGAGEGADVVPGHEPAVQAEGRQAHPVWAAGLRALRGNFIFFKLINLWSFVNVALGNKYSTISPT